MTSPTLMLYNYIEKIFSTNLKAGAEDHEGVSG